MLSGEEFLARLPRSRDLPTRSGQKTSCIEEADTVESGMDCSSKKTDFVNLLSEQRGLNQDRLVIADWLPDLGRARLRTVPSFFKTVGFSTGKPVEHFLHPEEAIFHAEVGQLDVRLDEMPLSVQELFSVVLSESNCDISMNEYVVYSHLMRAGFIVRRHQAVSQMRNEAAAVGGQDDIVLNLHDRPFLNMSADRLRLEELESNDVCQRIDPLVKQTDSWLQWKKQQQEQTKNDFSAAVTLSEQSLTTWNTLSGGSGCSPLVLPNANQTAEQVSRALALGANDDQDECISDSQSPNSTFHLRFLLHLKEDGYSKRKDLIPTHAVVIVPYSGCALCPNIFELLALKRQLCSPSITQLLFAFVDHGTVTFQSIEPVNLPQLRYNFL